MFLQPQTTLMKHKNVPKEQEEKTDPFQAFNYLDGLKNIANDSDLNLVNPTNPSKDKDIDQAYKGVLSAMQETKTNPKQLNELLMDDPERPELDQDAIDRNKKMTRMAAVMQALDSIAGAASLASQGDDAVYQPVRYDQMGLTGLNNIVQEQDEFDLDLQKYNQRKQEVDRYNTQLQQNVQQSNANIDMEIAQAELEKAMTEEERERIGSDEMAQWNYETGLRLISAGRADEAKGFFRDAGMSEDSISQITDTPRRTGGNGEEVEESEVRKFIDTYNLDPKSLTLYNRWKQLQSQIGEEDYSIDGKPQTRTARALERLEEDYGADFEFIEGNQQAQSFIGNQSKSNQPASTNFANDPITQNNQAQANITYQQMLMDGIVNAQTEEQRMESADLWLQNNTNMLKQQYPNLSDEEINELNDQMFALMLDDMTGDTSSGNQDMEEPAETQVAGQESSVSSMGNPPDVSQDSTSQNTQQNEYPENYNTDFERWFYDMDIKEDVRDSLKGMFEELQRRQSRPIQPN